MVQGATDLGIWSAGGMSKNIGQAARHEFARNLRTALAFRGKSASALASALGVAPASVHGFRQGRAMPCSSLLLAIANDLKVAVEFLLGGKDVEGQIEDVLQNAPPRMTNRQMYIRRLSRGET